MLYEYLVQVNRFHLHRSQIYSHSQYVAHDVGITLLQLHHHHYHYCSTTITIKTSTVTIITTTTSMITTINATTNYELFFVRIFYSV